MSADGRFIVGSESTLDLDTDGRGWNCDALAVSGDGSIVIGTCSEPVGNIVHPYPFLFNPERGSVTLASVLQAAGIDIGAYGDDFRLVDISSDGSTLLAGFSQNSVEAGLRIKIAGVFP